ncbi:unnamed protein product [Spirodela intermedia]|uniref:Uncharacterized protein n=1 Tax=Spirodela intermedia TaxID=51605 RepID=A0A7I8ISK5_SPIIN|nr:unnamed protein product [Spirodela intermedia]CAA6660849.1 unnamed protein product [Spirodela intermedia]
MPWKFGSLLARRQAAGFPDATVLRPGTRTLPPSLLRERHPRRSSVIQVHAQLITAGCHGSRGEAALRLSSPLRSDPHHGGAADSFTFSFLIKACANLSQPEKGRQVHGITIKKGFHPGVYVQTALLNMYCECRLLDEAGQVFDEMPDKNPVTWNAMITGLARYGEIDRARLTFEQMNHRNLISWTCLIDGYTRACRFHEALLLFCQMMAEGLSPTEVTILAIVPSICGVGSLDLAGRSTPSAIRAGSPLPTFAVKLFSSMVSLHGVEPEIKHYGCVIDMLGRVGRLEEPRR